MFLSADKYDRRQQGAELYPGRHRASYSSADCFASAWRCLALLGLLSIRLAKGIDLHIEQDEQMAVGA